MKPLAIHSVEALPRAARRLLDWMDGRRILCLYGPMGAGKTTLIRALCAELGVTDSVVSPTFALVNEYRTAGGVPVYHFDFYRIQRIEEVFDLGYEEYFYSPLGLCLLEWPELVEPLLPPQGVARLSIAAQPDGSRLVSPR